MITLTVLVASLVLAMGLTKAWNHAALALAESRETRAPVAEHAA